MTFIFDRKSKILEVNKFDQKSKGVRNQIKEY